MILLVNNYIANWDLGELEIAHYTGSTVNGFGHDYMVMKYDQVSSATLKEFPTITGVILGGSRDSWNDLYLDQVYRGEFDLIRNSTVPLLGICAGFQLMAAALGGEVRRCAYGKEEFEFRDLEIIEKSVLFDGISPKGTFWLYHTYEVVQVPDGYVNKASTPICANHFIERVGGVPSFGVQFHPEKHDGDHPDGKILIGNFLKLCRKEAMVMDTRAAAVSGGAV